MTSQLRTAFTWELCSASSLSCVSHTPVSFSLGLEGTKQGGDLREMLGVHPIAFISRKKGRRKLHVHLKKANTEIESQSCTRL